MKRVKLSANAIRRSGSSRKFMFLVLGLTACGPSSGQLNSRARPDSGSLSASAPTGLKIFAQSSSSWQNFAVPPMSGSFGLRFDAIPGASNINALTGLSSGPASSASPGAVVLRFNPSGMIDALNGSAYGAVKTISYRAGVAYHFEVDVNVTAKTYTALVTPDGDFPQILADGYAFASSQASINSLNDIGVWAGTGSHQIFQVDLSVPVNTSAAPIPSSTPSPSPSVTPIPTSSTPLATVSSMSVVSGSPFTVTVGNGPANPGDYIVLVPSTGDCVQPSGMLYRFLNDSTTQPAAGVSGATLNITASTATGPATAGSWKVVFCSGNGYSLLATSQAINITGGPTPASSPSPSPTSSNGAHLLFSSGFDGNVSLAAPSNGWQNISGKDTSTGFTWPFMLWGTGSTSIQTLTAAFQNQIQTVTGHTGAQTQALFQSMNNVNDWQSQDDLIVLPAISSPSQETDLYTSTWFKLQPNLATQLVPGQLNGFWGNWRSIAGWKTGGQGANYGGDFRTELMIRMQSNGQLCWGIEWDNNANGPYPYQAYYTPPDNCSVPVPVGQWFRLETFTHRASDNTGRYWAKMNGQVITDHFGPNIGVANLPINRFFPIIVYTNGNVPAYQWVDDFQVWDGVP